MWRSTHDRQFMILLLVSVRLSASANSLCKTWLCVTRCPLLSDWSRSFDPHFSILTRWSNQIRCPESRWVDSLLTICFDFGLTHTKWVVLQRTVDTFASWISLISCAVSLYRHISEVNFVYRIHVWSNSIDFHRRMLLFMDILHCVLTTTKVEWA